MVGEEKGNFYTDSSVSPRSGVHSLETGCSCPSSCGPCLVRGGRGWDMTPGCLGGPVSAQSPSKCDGEAGGRHPKCCGCCSMFRSFRIQPGSEAAFGVMMASAEGGCGSEGRPLPSLPRPPQKVHCSPCARRGHSLRVSVSLAPPSSLSQDAGFAGASREERLLGLTRESPQRQEGELQPVHPLGGSHRRDRAWGPKVAPVCSPGCSVLLRWGFFFPLLLSDWTVVDFQCCAHVCCIGK